MSVRSDVVIIASPATPSGIVVRRETVDWGTRQGGGPVETCLRFDCQSGPSLLIPLDDLRAAIAILDGEAA